MDKNKELKKKFLEYFSQLPVQKLAAGFIGRSEDWVADQKKDDEEFANQISLAKSAWALKKTRNVNKQWLLERLMNDHFGEKKKYELEGELVITVKKYHSDE